MQTPDKPTQRRRHGVTFRYGVWVGPAGVRMEVIRDGDAWRIYAYTSATDSRPEQISNYGDQADLFRTIAKLEAQGYRYDPDRTPRDTRTTPQERPRSRSVKIVLGTAVLCILLLAIEIVVLRR